MKKMEWAEVGRKYSRRQVGVESAGIERLDDDSHHMLSDQALSKFKEWALTTLEAEGVPARALVDNNAGEWTNEGEGLRHHVSGIWGTEPDGKLMLAARIYELARLMELVRNDPAIRPRLRANEEQMRAFQLGRLSMLAKVYGIDDSQHLAFQKKGAAARRVFTDTERAHWRALHTSDFADHSNRSAAIQIVRRLKLDESATETVRKELGKKAGKSL